VGGFALASIVVAWRGLTRAESLDRVTPSPLAGGHVFVSHNSALMMFFYLALAGAVIGAVLVAAWRLVGMRQPPFALESRLRRVVLAVTMAAVTVSLVGALAWTKPLHNRVEIDQVDHLVHISRESFAAALGLRSPQTVVVDLDSVVAVEWTLVEAMESPPTGRTRIVLADGERVAVPASGSTERALRVASQLALSAGVSLDCYFDPSGGRRYSSECDW
jgi:hypothetical protein